MQKLLELYKVGKSIKLTDWEENQLDSIELGDYNELLNVDISGNDLLNKDLELSGLSYSSFHKSRIGFNLRDIVKFASGAEATIQSLSVFLLIIDLNKVEYLIENVFNVRLSNKGHILRKGGIEIRIQKVETPDELFLKIFQTDNPKVINPKFWICESYSKVPFDKLKNPSFYLLHKALEYSIYQVLRKGSVGRHDLTIADVEEDILESGDIEVYVYNQMEDSKVHCRFNLIIKRI